MDRKRKRQEEATLRQHAWEKLTPMQQLEDLDRRLGRGMGAVKQRARIEKVLKK